MPNNTTQCPYPGLECITTEYKISAAKTGEFPMCCKKYLKNTKHNSLLVQKYARRFVLGHYLFLEATSFLQAMLQENCSFLRTDNGCGQISVHIFVPNGDYCLCVSQSRRLFIVNEDVQYLQQSNIIIETVIGQFSKASSLYEGLGY